ncbi:type 2 isopentenyl-diphosphate Delta-isomerase [Candidatus Woesearchaeota archaeon]|nr:type 2 isopentenyl-diphosphate Delta-isomerase [Candidatus Woesearchaeota archaeon]
MTNRKKEHIDICLNKNVEYGDTGFEYYRFTHNALPEVNMQEIDTSVDFLGKNINAPIIISAVTYDREHQELTTNLAKAAEKLKLVMSLGSQRILIEQPQMAMDEDIRKHCPTIPLLANLGAIQLNYGFSANECNKIIQNVKADALVLHLNPLQEAIQPEGQTNFKYLLSKIKKIVDNLDCPVIVKEVGSGISKDVAFKLKQIGVSIIDVAGHGGTNWALIEGHRANNRLGETFREWGIPTVEAISQCNDVDLQLIAGGGIRSGLDIAKAIALGADYVSIALPLLRPATISEGEVIKILQQFIHELKITMFCIGAKNIKELQNTKALVKVK